jgi:hypothetical protein
MSQAVTSLTLRAHLSIAALLLAVSSVAAVDLKTCNADIQSRLDNGTLSPHDTIFFFNGSSSMSQRGQLQLTIDGCRAQCPTPDMDFYSDMWQRLLTWLIPVILLLGSVHLPRVGSLNRLFVILHFVGDPVDSIWSLLTKAEIWNRFYRIAYAHTPSTAVPNREAVACTTAVLLSAFEELTGDTTSVQAMFDNFGEDALLHGSMSREDLDYIMADTADELVDSRSNEVLRTVLVIINYLWAVLAALVPDIGGTQSSQPGGRIGTAMFLSWLITGVLLSNTLSGFTSRRTCLRIVGRYCRTLEGRKRGVHILSDGPRPDCQHDWASGGTDTVLPSIFFESQPWNGGVYSFRTNKRLPSSGSGKSHDRSPAYLLMLSVAPVVISCITAFVIIWFTPTIGLGCRTLWVLGLSVGLLLSPVLTWVLSRITGGKLRWYLTIAKDTIIGIGCIAVILLSSIGIFNTCWCW